MKLNEKKIKYIIREKELDGLIDEIKKYNSLIVLYGNRRVGKTEMVSEIPKKAKDLISKLGIDLDILRKK